MAKSPRHPARAETVGSLLRPLRLKSAIESFYEQGHSAVLAGERARDRGELQRLEDEAIEQAVRRQVDAGLDVVTDGEFRRWMFLNSFYDAVEGFETTNVGACTCGKSSRTSTEYTKPRCSAATSAEAASR